MVKWILLALGILIIARAIKKGIRQKSWFNARGKAVAQKEFSIADFLLALFLYDILFSRPDQQSDDDWQEKEEDDELDIFESCSIFDMDCDAIPDMFESEIIDEALREYFEKKEKEKWQKGVDLAMKDQEYMQFCQELGNDDGGIV